MTVPGAPSPSPPLRDEGLSRQAKVRFIAQNLFHTDHDRRLAAIRSVGASRDPWLNRLLLYKTADGDREVARQAETALRERGADLVSLYLVELHGPHVDVRAAAVRLLGWTGGLEQVPDLCERLFDYHVSVRDAARTALRRIVERNPRIPEDPAGRPQVHRILLLFGELCGSLDVGVRHLALDLTLSFGRLFPDDFWEVYLGLDLRRKKLLHLEIMRQKSSESIALIYRGLCHENSEIREAMGNLIFTNLDQEDLNLHLEAVGQMPEADQRLVVDLYRQHDILPRFLSVAAWLRQTPRLTLIRLLTYLGPVAYRDFLVDCLNLTDRPTRLAVLDIAEKYPLDLPREKAVQLLREGDSELALGVLTFLEAKGTFESVREMTPFFQSEEEDVRNSALSAVFRISRDHLLERYDRIPSRVRAELARFLLKMNERFAAELARQLPDLDEDERLRNVEIISYLAGDPRARSVLEGLLLFPDGKVRATAARALERYEEVDRVAVLRPLLSDEDSRVRANAIEELPANAADAELVAALADCAKSNHNRERANAICKLLAMGMREHERELAEMLESPDLWVRTSGLWALSQAEAPALLDHARKGLDDPSPAVRRMAVLALGAHAPLDEIRGFTRHLVDADPGVRRAARDVLRNRLKIDYEVSL